MKKYKVTGMSCAACQARVEKAVSQMNGIESCSVNLLTNTLLVEGDVSDSDIEKVVEKAGYGIESDAEVKTKKEDYLEDKETPVLKKRLVSSIAFLIILMFFSMGPMIGLKLPAFIRDNYLAQAIIQMLLAMIVMFINRKFFINGFKGIINKSPNMDTLVAMGSGVSFIYSLYGVYMMTVMYSNGTPEEAMHYMHELYFESAAMILALITVGKMLEAHSKGKTTNALKSLLSLAPKKAIILVNGVEKEVDVADVKQGDTFVVKPGGSIPVDGQVIEGFSAVNESALTGESLPVDKEVGSSVSAATINTSGYLKCVATHVGEDTSIAQIIKMVSESAATKAPIAKIADKVSGVFVPAVISISIITLIIWLVVGYPFGFALARAISVLVISCPCALGLATPVAIMVGNGVGAKNGILFKNSIALEQTGKIDIVALDKTGTITSGVPVVTDIIDYNTPDLLEVAYSLEAKSEHPLAKAIITKAKDSGLKIKASEDFMVYPGNGVSAKIDGVMVYGGNLSFVEDKCEITDEIKSTADELAKKAKTPLYFVRENKIIGIIATADEIKHDSKEAIKCLKNLGIKTVMLTGDNEKTANVVKEEIGVDEVVAGVLPTGKADVIKNLQKHGNVAMVGDGINDALALTTANIGIAIGAGTDVAVDAADIVLMKSSLMDVVKSIRLSRATITNIHENLFWAFIYNTIGIPLAAGAFYVAFGLKLNPMIGAAAMSLSSFCVVTNALRLNMFKIDSPKHDHKKQSKNKKESGTMEKIIKADGMMCQHCVARVTEALMKVKGVEAVDVTLETKEVKITLSKDVDDAKLEKAITKAGYTVIK